MSEENRPEYHKAPHTLDPNREIPEDAAPAAGHDEEQADAVKAADEEFTEGVQAEQEHIAEHGEVGPQVPGKPGVQPGSEEDRESDAQNDDDDVPDGTVSEVLDWVGDDPERLTARSRSRSGPEPPDARE